MAVRIRVYPNGAAGGYGGAYGAAPLAIAQTELDNERKTGNLRLQYERALWAEKLKTTQLQTAMQYQGQTPYAAGYGALGGSFLGGLGMGGMLGGVLPGAGVVPGGYGGVMPGLAGGAGQTNITSQTGTGGSQTVSNNNSYSSVSRFQAPPAWGGGWGGGYGSQFGGGGFLSSLLGALI